MKGWLAVIFALFAGIFLPALFPARGFPTAGPSGFLGQVPLATWLIAAVTMLICLAVCLLALVRGSTPDRVAAVIAALVNVWMIIAFVSHAL
jgi:hypothetical protein